MKKKITFISLIIICIIMFLITTFCPFYKVEGNSMSPTLKNNDYVCIKKTKSFLNTHIPQVIIKIRNDSFNFLGFYV